MEDFNNCFVEVTDPRQDNARHNLHEILMIALCTMLCGGEDCSEYHDLGGYGHGPQDADLSGRRPGGAAADDFEAVVQGMASISAAMPIS